MVDKEKKIDKLRRKLFNRYHLNVTNADTHEERFRLGLTRLNLIFIGLITAFLISVGTFMLIVYTPLKEYISGYYPKEIREEAMVNFLRLDSLLSVQSSNEEYLKRVKKVLLNEDEEEIVESRDSVLSPTQIHIKTTRSKDDSLLRAQVEREDKFNIFLDSPSRTDYVFFTPANGNISEGFNLKDKHFGIDLVLNKHEPVKTIGKGTVIFSEWTANTGFVIIIEHPYDFISVYKHNSSLHKLQGDFVEAGEVIATAGNTGEYSTGWHLHFELWSDGYPVDPTNFIDFSKE